MTWRPISEIEAESSSAVAATVCTLAVAWSDARGRLHLGRRGADTIDDLFDRALEAIRHLVHGLAFLFLGTLLCGGLIFFQTHLFDGAVLEDLNRTGHLADFIIAPGAWHLGIKVATGQRCHGPGHLVQRPAHQRLNHQQQNND
jgi:hypothetical protein